MSAQSAFPYNCCQVCLTWITPGDAVTFHFIDNCLPSYTTCRSCMSSTKKLLTPVHYLILKTPLSACAGRVCSSFYELQKEYEALENKEGVSFSVAGGITTWLNFERFSNEYQNDIIGTPSLVKGWKPNKEFLDMRVKGLSRMKREIEEEESQLADLLPRKNALDKLKRKGPGDDETVYEDVFDFSLDGVEDLVVELKGLQGYIDDVNKQIAEKRLEINKLSDDVLKSGVRSLGEDETANDFKKSIQYDLIELRRELAGEIEDFFGSFAEGISDLSDLFTDLRDSDWMDDMNEPIDEVEENIARHVEHVEAEREDQPEKKPAKKKVKKTKA